MKKITANEMRNIEGGRTKCSKCGKKFWGVITFLEHRITESCYGKGKFCL